MANWDFAEKWFIPALSTLITLVVSSLLELYRQNKSSRWTRQQVLWEKRVGTLLEIEEFSSRLVDHACAFEAGCDWEPGAELIMRLKNSAQQMYGFFAVAATINKFIGCAEKVMKNPEDGILRSMLLQAYDGLMKALSRAIKDYDSLRRYGGRNYSQTRKMMTYCVMASSIGAFVDQIPPFLIDFKECLSEGTTKKGLLELVSPLARSGEKCAFFNGRWVPWFRLVRKLAVSCSKLEQHLLNGVPEEVIMVHLKRIELAYKGARRCNKWLWERATGKYFSHSSFT